MTTQKHFKFLKSQKQDVKLANTFYKHQRFKGKARKGEWLSQAWRNDQLIALLRLTAMDDFFLLRNLCVHLSHRNEGVGSELLAYTRLHSTQDIYTFPLAHILTWYQANGATQIEPSQLPTALQPLYDRYCVTNPSLKCSVFKAAKNI